MLHNDGVSMRGEKYTDILYCWRYLRLDNTGAWVVEFNPSLLRNQMNKNTDLYIKLKLGIFSII